MKKIIVIILCLISCSKLSAQFPETWDTVMVDNVAYRIHNIKAVNYKSIGQLSNYRIDGPDYTFTYDSATLDNDYEQLNYRIAAEIFKYYLPVMKPNHHIIAVVCLCDRMGRIVELYFCFNTDVYLDSIPKEYFADWEKMIKSQIVFNIPPNWQKPYMKGGFEIEFDKIE